MLQALVQKQARYSNVINKQATINVFIASTKLNAPMENYFHWQPKCHNDVKFLTSSE